MQQATRAAPVAVQLLLLLLLHAALLQQSAAGAAAALGRRSASGAGHANRELARHALAAAGSRRDATETLEVSPTCSCDCCTVAERRPDEVVGAVHIKCAPSDEHSSDVCGERCLPAQNDKVLKPVVEDEVDYQRFCFFECKPAQGLASLVKAQCIALEAAEAKRVIDANGNAMDPAFLYGDTPSAGSGTQGSSLADVAATAGGAEQPDGEGQPYDAAPSALLLATARGLRAGAAGARLRASSPSPAPGPAPAGLAQPSPAPAGADPVAAAVDLAVMGRKSALDMMEGASKAAEAVRQLEEAKISGGYHDPLAAVQDITRAARGSQAAAERSGAAARAALESLHQAEHTSWEAAVAAAGSEVLKMRHEAERRALTTANAPRKWRDLAAEAAREASRPYLQAVNYAQQSAEQWYVRAAQLGEKARRLEAESHVLSSKAERLWKEGSEEQAKLAEADAQREQEASQKYAKQARDMYATAQAAVKSANGYYAVAGEAARRAALTVTLRPAPAGT